MGHLIVCPHPPTARVYNRREVESVTLRIWRCMPSLAKVYDLSLVFVLALKPKVHACLNRKRTPYVRRYFCTYCTACYPDPSSSRCCPRSTLSTTSLASLRTKFLDRALWRETRPRLRSLGSKRSYHDKFGDPSVSERSRVIQPLHRLADALVDG